MIVTFNEVYLKELFETGASSDKKHRYQPQVIKGYKKGINLMLSVDSMNSLAKFNSLNLELLQGDKAGVYSIRANLQYRIEFTAEEIDGKEHIVICNILDLSNHYK